MIGRRVVVLVALGVLAAGAVGGAGPAQAEGTVTVSGHGYGHGRGMSQYGAYGYATEYGWNHQQILGHYYGGTTIGARPNSPVTVRLVSLDGPTLTVTSGAAFTVAGVLVSGGSAATVSLRPDGLIELVTSSGCGEAPVWSTLIPSTDVISTVAVPTSFSDLLSVCAGGEQRGYRGWLRLAGDGGGRVVNTVWLEDYLRGVVPRESPASWGDAAGEQGMSALRAQAVAARSYAWSEGRAPYAQTCDTTSCQVYRGAALNGEPIEDPRTDAAIADTAGQVLVDAGDVVVRAEFHSSSGGYTAGGAFPAVPDDGDAVSPHHDWTVTVPAGALGVGTVTAVDVLARNGLGADGGRVETVRVTGTAGAVEMSGASFRSKLKLKSDWFTLG